MCLLVRTSTSCAQDTRLEGAFFRTIDLFSIVFRAGGNPDFASHFRCPLRETVRDGIGGGGGASLSLGLPLSTTNARASCFSDDDDDYDEHLHPPSPHPPLSVSLPTCRLYEGSESRHSHRRDICGQEGGIFSQFLIPHARRGSPNCALLSLSFWRRQVKFAFLNGRQ